MQKKLYSLSAKEIRDNILNKKTTAEEVSRSFIERIRECEHKVKAWAYFDEGVFMEQAKNVDRKNIYSASLGAMAGVPVGVKDIFNTSDMPTAMGSPLWNGFTPGNDARCVFDLRQSNAIIAGKTVTAEFAVHEPGPTRNPYDLDRYPGTSSSGSAVAVACGMVPVALGTQTAGSLIRPASYCGVYAFKPTFGIIPRTAVLKTADTLDQIGWFARSLSDLSLVFNTIRVKGPNYPYVHNFIDKKGGTCLKRKKWKIFFVKHPKWDYADAYAKKAVEGLTKKLSTFEDMSVMTGELPKEFLDAHEVHDVIYNKSLSYYFAEEYKSKHFVSKVFCDLLEKGKEIKPNKYLSALDKQVMLRDRIDNIFEEHDVIVTLSTSGEAPFFFEPIDKPDSCLIWNLCGVPVANLPVFKGPSGLPFGLQVVARRYNDELLLDFCEYLCSEGFLPHTLKPQTPVSKDNL